MKEIKTILIDVDGVLTDGKVWYNHMGERTKGFHSRDIRSIRELISHGFDVYLITASTWSGLKDYAARTGAIILVDREKVCDQFENYIAIGDDVTDIRMLRKAHKAFCPANADDLVKHMDKITVLNCPAGEGVIAELVRLVLKIDEYQFPENYDHKIAGVNGQ